MTADPIAAARAMLEEMDRPGFFTSNGYHFPCRELRNMVATLTAALEAERKRAEKAETERDEWKDEYQTAARGRNVYKEISVNLQIERVQDLALVAAAYEAVANITRSHIYYDSAGSGFREDEFDDAIRDLTPADAQAALDKLLAEARLEGWRAGRDAAAEEATLYDCSEGGDDYSIGIQTGYRDAVGQIVEGIRALPEPKENSHDCPPDH